MNGSYNGWADMPEEEREALGAYEAGVAAAAEPVRARRTVPLLIKAAMGVLVQRASRRVV